MSLFTTFVSKFMERKEDAKGTFSRLCSGDATLITAGQTILDALFAEVVGDVALSMRTEGLTLGTTGGSLLKVPSSSQRSATSAAATNASPRTTTTPMMMTKSSSSSGNHHAKTRLASNASTPSTAVLDDIKPNLAHLPALKPTLKAPLTSKAAVLPSPPPPLLKPKPISLLQPPKLSKQPLTKVAAAVNANKPFPILPSGTKRTLLTSLEYFQFDDHHAATANDDDVNPFTWGLSSPASSSATVEGGGSGNDQEDPDWKPIGGFKVPGRRPVKPSSPSVAKKARSLKLPTISKLVQVQSVNLKNSEEAAVMVTCGICGQAFKNKRALRTHEMRTHKVASKRMGKVGSRVPGTAIDILSLHLQHPTVIKKHYRCKYPRCSTGTSKGTNISVLSGLVLKHICIDHLGDPEAAPETRLKANRWLEVVGPDGQALPEETDHHHHHLEEDHLGDRQVDDDSYKEHYCTWSGCTFKSAWRGSVVKHICRTHLKDAQVKPETRKIAIGFCGRTTKDGRGRGGRRRKDNAVEEPEEAVELGRGVDDQQNNQETITFNPGELVICPEDAERLGIQEAYLHLEGGQAAVVLNSGSKSFIEAVSIADSIQIVNSGTEEEVLEEAPKPNPVGGVGGGKPVILPCSWPACQYEATDKELVIDHIRSVHLKLKKNSKELPSSSMEI